MQFNFPEMSSLLAREHHRSLIEDARRYREQVAARRSTSELPLRRNWRYRLRHRVGELLVYMGQWLKADASNTVWG